MSKKPTREQVLYWYNKLADEGFHDLEYRNSTKRFLGRRYIRRPLSYISNKYDDYTRQHFTACESFTHNTRSLRKMCRKHLESQLKTRDARKKYRTLCSRKLFYRQIEDIAHLYIEGSSYRQIQMRMSKLYPINTLSLTAVHYILKTFKSEAHKWNHSHPDGIWYEHDRVDDVELKPMKSNKATKLN